ncbi:MAG: DUF1653 domain-containing protein [Lachnospiraceae bacterium]|nr:DUF1653 domain-containing protein [Lachnospiraceae bacterium]
MTVEIGKFYRHFKGKNYQVLNIATHSETGEQMVIYQALYGRFEVFCRPLDSFCEMLDRSKYPDSSQLYRFVETTADAVEKQSSAAAVSERADVSGSKDTAGDYAGSTQANAAAESAAYVPLYDSSEDNVERAAPVLMMFLEAEDAQSKFNVLKEHYLEIDQRTMTNIEVSMDVISTTDDMDERIRFVMDVLKTRMRYENNRLR